MSNITFSYLNTKPDMSATREQKGLKRLVNCGEQNIKFWKKETDMF